ncbi:MAG: TVP38/TMEM64 family protein [Desulfovibrionaceae bacterium]
MLQSPARPASRRRSTAPDAAASCPPGFSCRTTVRSLCSAFPPRLLTLPLLLAVLFALCSHYDVARLLHREWLAAHILERGWTGLALYVAIVGAVTACGVPRQLCAMLGGWLFGPAGGTLLATCGTGLGCLLTFGYARFLGRNWLDRAFSRKFRKLDSFLRQSPFLLTCCVRVVPLGSNFLTNIAAGVSGLPALPFLAGSLLGFSVQNAIFATIGSGLEVGASTQRALGAGLYLLSLALGLIIWRRWKRHAANGEQR